MKKIIMTLPQTILTILLSPNKMRSTLLAIKWQIDTAHGEDLYTKLVDLNKELFDYFGIYDNESLRTKILDAVKFMD